MNSKGNQSDNRKALPKFLLLIFGCAILGGVLGFFAGWAGYSDLPAAVSGMIDGFLRAVTPWAIPVLSVVMLGATAWLYGAAKRQFAAWDGEDETVIDGVELRLSWALLLVGLLLIVNFFFLSASTICLEGAVPQLLTVGGFLLSCAAIVLLQQKVVDLEKTINPEKQGSVYDLKFQKKWLESCDEAEQRQIGQASHRACAVAGQFCIWLWVALVVLNYVFDFGLFPIFLVLLIWGVLQVTYIVECIRMAKRGA